MLAGVAGRLTENAKKWFARRGLRAGEEARGHGRVPVHILVDNGDFSEPVPAAKRTG